jgi:hypothetical protein
MTSVTKKQFIGQGHIFQVSFVWKLMWKCVPMLRMKGKEYLHKCQRTVDIRDYAPKS